ncbi:fatty acid synthase, partial [Nephila pilipes]
VWLVSQDDPTNGIIGLVNCLKQEPGGDRISNHAGYLNVERMSEDPHQDILSGTSAETGRIHADKYFASLISIYQEKLKLHPLFLLN